jgi:molecular chaperone HtpG
MSTQELGFKAEVQQLLDLMIHSVYSERDVFLRELVSNAADALDKARFLGLTRDDLTQAAHEEPAIRITVDDEAKVIVIEDDGIGMSREEAVLHLGTIAHSGSREFLNELESAEDKPSLIGQFGVGFYSCFMVAREVQVETRSALPDVPAVRWTSQGAGTYTVEEVERVHRGTTITMFLRDDAVEFADAAKLSDVVKRHSDFLPWPVWVGEEKANTARAIWHESPSSLSDEEANQFYKSVSHDWREPALRIHARVDSPIQYAALLFVPSDRPFDLLQPDAERGPRLYARRVMIVEHARDLLPDWLRFVKGVVDSEDITLNVSREMVQKTSTVRRIRKALTKKVLKELASLARREAREAEEASEPTEGELIDGEEVEAPTAPTQHYLQIWKAFGMLLKEGFYHERDDWGDYLLPLFRFSHVEGDDDVLISLADYKEAMPEGQDTIWYLTSDSREAALRSPHLEGARKHGWNVLLMTDPVDEWLMQVLSEFDGVPVKSVARGEFTNDEADEENDEEKLDLIELTPWLESIYAGAVSSVRPSKRLTDSPCVLVDDEQGPSANMERLMKAANQPVFGVKRHLELNARHPIVRNLAALHSGGQDAVAAPMARLLLDNAFLMEGTVDDAQGIGQRLQAMLEQASSSALATAAPAEGA